MKKVWYRDSSEENLADLHISDPPQYIDNDTLFRETRTKITKITPEVFNDENALEDLRKKGGYGYYDRLTISRDHLPDYDAKLKAFYTEHLHEDDEIRLFIEGSGFFEVRDKQNRWVRIHVGPGDLLNLLRRD